MVRYRTLLAGLLLAGHASATSHHALFPRRHELGHILQRDSEDLVATLTRRQQDEQDSDTEEDEPQVSTTPASGDAALADIAKWEADTSAACDSAMVQLDGQVSNPSGIAVCYNLPFLDNQTGVFLAELRLYNVMQPIDPWRGITPADINLELSYLGATVQSTSGIVRKRDVSGSSALRARVEANLLAAKRQNAPGTPEVLKVLMYVGRINDNVMGTAMTQAILQPLLIPQIKLIATSQSGQEITAGLSSEEASFVNGVFADSGTTNTDDPAAAASATAAAAAAAPFELPGTSLAFFPVGLVITSVWTAAFFLAVGLGTFGRMQFREQYRRRIKREVANGVRTI